MSKVIVGMSGGVDSAVTAYLLKIAGYEVIGVTLRTWMTADGKDSRCCEIDDAERVAAALDIPYFVRSCMTPFREQITEPFVREYLSGRTPSPCVVCNRRIKWEGLLEAAGTMQADWVATGHYASVLRLPNGRYTVKQAEHAEKDQTYMLYRLRQEQLSRTLMPLGKLSKEEVRQIAVRAGLPVADKPDSQEICFIPDGSYADYIEEHAGSELPGEGNFVDESGRVLGRHRGIYHYTVGQRKGLGIAFGVPMFVGRIDAARNEVVLCRDSGLFHREVLCGDLNLMGIPELKAGESLRVRAKIRYRHEAAAASASILPDGRLKLLFDEPVRAATPGQSAVMYDEAGCVLGGGVITEPDTVSEYKV